MVTGWRLGAWSASMLCVLVAVGAAIAQHSRRVSERYESEMQDPVEDPPDADRKGEFGLGRLRFRSPLDGRRFGGYTRWGIDANKGDRLFAAILKRLTRIDVESVETIVDVDDDAIFDSPFLFAVSVGDWRLTPAQAARIGEYLRRGGFLFVDDFHNDREWQTFMDGVRQMNINSMPEELTGDASAFNVLFNLKERIRVSGANALGSGVERGGIEPHWRAIMDSKGRIMIAISFNQDIGDGWEFADVPWYPERMSSAAMRLGTNYVVYAMTH